MGKQKRGIFSESGRKLDLEYFWEIGMILRLRQKLEFSWNIFEELKLDSESICPKRRGKRNWT